MFGRHFHMEQPQGSGLIKLEAMKEVLKHVQVASFDMCRFGLKIPGTNSYLRKRSVVLTTSLQLFETLDGQRCQQDHFHLRIEGTFSLGGVSTRVTHFCPSYCKRFAKILARCLCRLNHAPCYTQVAHALDLDPEEHQLRDLVFPLT